MSASPKWVPSAPGLKEEPDSGEYNYGDRQTYTQIYTGKYADCKAALLGKGTVGTGGLAGWFVDSSRVVRSRGDVGRLIIVWTGFDGVILPADQYALTPGELNPATEYNPAFSSVTQTELEKIRIAVFNADDATAPAARTFINTSGSTAAKKLMDLLARGTSNYYEASFIYTWVQHFSSLPSVNSGGYIETPGGPLASTISGLGLSCLRQADDLSYSDGIFKRTRTWNCGPAGFWDTTLYA